MNTQTFYAQKDRFMAYCRCFWTKPLYSRLLFPLLLTAVVVLLLVVAFTPARAEATDLHAPVRSVTSICIHEGETLWSIASEYYTAGEGSLNDYIETIKQTNHLSSDRIRSGGYLVIPYYASVSDLE